jgi:hypothetical protein
VDLLGPQGNGFKVDADRLLLVADVQFFPVLMPLIDCAPSISIILESSSRIQLPSPQIFPPYVEVELVTLDGSTGYLGPLESSDPAPAGYIRANTVLMELLGWAEQVCLAFKVDRYPDLAAVIYNARFNPRENFAQAIIKTQMPCGTGVCDVCCISTLRGERHICIDGPVFDLIELRNEDI